MQPKKENSVWLSLVGVLWLDTFNTVSKYWTPNGKPEIFLNLLFEIGSFFKYSLWFVSMWKMLWEEHIISSKMLVEFTSDTSYLLGIVSDLLCVLNLWGNWFSIVDFWLAGLGSTSMWKTRNCSHSHSIWLFVISWAAGRPSLVQIQNPVLCKYLALPQLASGYPRNSFQSQAVLLRRIRLPVYEHSFCLS